MTDSGMESDEASNVEEQGSTRLVSSQLRGRRWTPTRESVPRARTWQQILWEPGKRELGIEAEPGKRELIVARPKLWSR
jgi:hypothetical protein